MTAETKSESMDAKQACDLLAQALLDFDDGITGELSAVRDLCVVVDMLLGDQLFADGCPAEREMSNSLWRHVRAAQRALEVLDESHAKWLELARKGSGRVVPVDFSGHPTVAEANAVRKVLDTLGVKFTDDQIADALTG